MFKKLFGLAVLGALYCAAKSIVEFDRQLVEDGILY